MAVVLPYTLTAGQPENVTHLNANLNALRVGVDDAQALINTIEAKTDNYTLVTADAGKLITVNAASGKNMTVNAALDFTPGQYVYLCQLGAGQVTVVASSTTVNATPTLKLRTQYSCATLFCIAADTYVLSGDLAFT
jgi:hypothetical protein